MAGNQHSNEPAVPPVVANDPAAYESPGITRAMEIGPSLPPARVSRVLLVRLATIMFLQYIPAGLWVAPLGLYIAANTGTAGSGMFREGFVGYSASCGALGALIAPVFFGMLADGLFRTDRLLFVLNLLCAASLLLLTQTRSQTWFFLAMLAYYQFSVPTMTLCNSMSLRQLGDAKRTFPAIRAAGTVGWVVAGLLVGLLGGYLWQGGIEHTNAPQYWAAAAHLVVAAFCLTLPNTPPAQGLVSWRSMISGCGRLINGTPSLRVFLLVLLLAAIPVQFYGSYGVVMAKQAGMESATSQLTIGQITEIACLVGTPLLIARIGTQWTILLGIACWSLRYLLLAYGGPAGLPLAMIYTSIFIHGLCYSFMYVSGFLYVDEVAPADARAVAQGVFTVATSGIGHLTGGILSGICQTIWLTPVGISPPPYDWWPFWMVPTLMSAASAAAFWVLICMPGAPHPTQTSRSA